MNGFFLLAMSEVEANERWSEMLAGPAGVVFGLIFFLWIIMTFLLPFMVWEIRGNTRKTCKLLEDQLAAERQQNQWILVELKKLNGTLGAAEIRRE